ncbi:protein-L-isoaspartate O-methyltransferase [Enterovirga sp.]|uniref:protein-L-isoaspartate O-methyltransferase family protein n=1 Tax=Enterovirga sp. TaxID=2026350 RepID=UPI002CCE3A51|nr:protein-L-isoaspartate O-methyltransferase [Enterovirga sp.]HMO30493.1 rRNA adenine N-6-methyltransferase family protein [Enterovirga sp.]
MTSFDAARRTMVDCQLRTFDVSDRAVLAAMAEVPRERFVPPGREALAYLDRNLILDGDEADPRVMLAPMTMARLLQALEVQEDDKVLDVGGGLGYSSALFVALGAKPVLLESRADLAAAAAANLGSAVPVRTGPLGEGARADGPFECILINGATELRPEALLDQLANGGRLACVSREGGVGRAMLYVRSGSGIGYRAVFDVTAPVLAAFRPEPAFSF